MKKNILLFTALSALTCTNASAVSIAVPNGDFEDRTGSQYAASQNWITTGGGYIAAELNSGIFSADADGNANGTYLFYEDGGQSVSSSALATIQANTLYTATVDVGNPFASYGQQPSSYMIEILLGGTTVSSTEYTNTELGTTSEDSWTTISTSYASQVADSGDLTIRLSMGTNEDGNNQYFFDNVTFDAAAVPEPSSVSLLGLAGLGLITRRRR
ncbi:hypothetical protein Rhal01_01339 [Rubritalea halochordaticola]|uniref:Ice-binding protein C-terminal domain-containing protein n=1 Tax=Rubritalea halochordaticola TaxID=714537 RepID=A0ABP9UXH9_9BACT